ncbi:MAG: hypothetical protein IJC50_05410 [Clostridia bacterium]|nr:hypothetical protein [Clostridia bacterium]
MTAGEVIRRFDDLRRNDLPLDVKLDCLDQLENNVACDFGFDKPERVGQSTPLIAKNRPELYFLQLCARLDFENRDFERQENDLKLFAAEYARFAAETVRRSVRGGRMKVGGV